MSELKTEMDQLGQAAKNAAAILAQATAETKNQALSAAAIALRSQTKTILEANAKDMAAAEKKGLSSALLDRLALTPERVDAMAFGLEAIAAFPDPVGQSLASWQQPNGLKFERISVPLGVIGIIYESRPNVTADAGALSLKAGNAAILRGGSESYHSSKAILQCLQSGLETAGLPVAAIQCVPTTDRAAVGHLLTMNGTVDLIIPRGGRGLIERIQNESRVPVLAHLDGLCHTYLHASASPAMALEIVLNAKMRRTGVCGATETLLVDQGFTDSDLKPILEALMTKGCEIRGDESICALDNRVIPATAADWDTEYLDAILSVRKVPDLAAAIAHIARHGSSHTEAIIAEDLEAVTAFQKQVDAGIVIHNASTQYADGGEFGMGAEIGISTGKLHARGPVGASQLTSYKYLVRGTGQIRP
ncbi:glutamate-5-semialdehyde dehydrogenase [Kiloniella laminariae]|uniref:glutamate-5-semialdehyde dehydrogenase n=1 Tax=Kiloniella laminariae TaxID=454162 RepID=UPI0003666083|nr:glutamate-5-semialdehyde dehydrogenase [Kiloniella laminariae]